MKKFYEKSEIWFSIMWIIIYVVVMGTIRSNFGDDSYISVIVIAVFALGLTAFIVINGLTDKYGFKKVTNAKKYLYFIPLIILMSVNFWSGCAFQYRLANQLCAVFTMLLVGYIEELLFRGFLFKAIEKNSAKRAIIISAITFGAGHIINLLTGQASVETLLQIAYAIAIGFAFAMVYYKSKSLWPCIITHSVVNMTSTFSKYTPVTTGIIISVVVIIVAGSYALYLSRKEV